MAKPNPFPNYQVVRLTDSPDSVEKKSFPTHEINEARALVKDYASSFIEGAPTSGRRPTMIAIIGDYGTGKTHLLLYAASRLQEELGPKQPTVLRITAPEDTPSAWFRVEPSPFSSLPFEDLMTRIFNEAGTSVAKSARLTQNEVVRLGQDPTFLLQLIEDSKINVSGVEDEFHNLIQQICGDYVSADVRSAFAAVASNSTATAARKWLLGGVLSEDEMSNIHVQRSSAGDPEISGILIASSALHSHLRMPFALLVDELEHFADYDRAHGNKRNLTWLKRLLEAFASSSPLVLVAGHTSAWEVEPNLSARFANQIRMLVLSPRDILDILRFALGREPDHFDEQIVAIHEATGGKMREVVTLCSILWDESDGFRKSLDPEAIRRNISTWGPRAIDEVQGLLQEKQFSTRRPATIARNVEFDLVGFRAGIPELVFDFRHFITQQNPKAQVNRFLEKVSEVAAVFPQLLGLLCGRRQYRSRFGRYCAVVSRPTRSLF